MQRLRFDEWAEAPANHPVSPEVCAFIQPTEDGADVAWIGDQIVGEFRPARTDDLRPEAVPLIGQTRLWEFVGYQDGGPYAGQAMWMPIPFVPGIAWVPDEDIQRSPAEGTDKPID